MAAADQLLEVFSQSILAKINALKCLELTPHQSRRLGKSITDDIRTCGGFIFPGVKPPEVSKRAQELAQSIGTNLFEMNWYTQAKFDKGRKKFQWEHVNTVASIRRKCEQAKTAEEIVEILKCCMRIAWILKDEDKRLTANGKRSKRDDAVAAYREAGIELLTFQVGISEGS